MKTNRYNIINYIVKVTFLLLVLVAGFFSCKDENNDPMPAVTNFRVVVKDSSITEGAFGLTIAIQGTNLQNVQEVWFNDLKAFLNPNFVTSTNIICVVPDKAPGEVLNKVKLVTGGGQVFTTDFKVVLPKPIVKGLYNEMAAPGTTTQVLGDYFFLIKSVKIGELNAEILASTEHAITIKIPAGALPKSFVTIEGEGGTTVSTFKYHNEGVWLTDYDQPGTTWNSIWCWGSWTDKNREDGESINKKYGFIQGKLNENAEYLASTCSNFPAESNYPTQVSNMDLTGKVLKFEVNAKEPWIWNDKLKPEENATLTVSIDNKSYVFRPQEWSVYKKAGFTTDGWMTVTAPLSAIGITGVTTVHDFRLTFKTNKQAYDKFSTYFDNFRICDAQ